MAVCVSMINMKGGVGKTTIATQIAWYATRQLDKKVLLDRPRSPGKCQSISHVATDLRLLPGWRRSYRG